MATIKKFKTATGEVRYRARPLVGMQNGKPVQLCRTFDNAKAARDWAAEQVTKWNRGEGVVGRYTMAVLFDDLKRNFKNRGRSKWADIVMRAHLEPYFGAFRTEQVTTAVLERYIEKRREAGRANGTIMRELALLKRAFNLARQTTPPKVAVVPHFPRLQEASPRQGFFEQTEYAKMLEALPEELRPVLIFAFHTGCRRGEILRLRWNQVDLAERTIRLNAGETKNREGRVIPLAKDVVEVLRMQRGIRDQYWPDCPWVFFRHGSGQPLKSFRTAWALASKRAGLWDEVKKRPTRLLHDLRRTGVRNLVRSGVPERVAMAISGHKTRAIFDRYNITSEADLKDAVHRLDEYLEVSRDKNAKETSKPLVTGSEGTDAAHPQDGRKLLH